MTDLATQIVRDVHAEFVDQGRLTISPDAPPSVEDELAFWAAVEARLGTLQEDWRSQPRDPGGEGGGQWIKTGVLSQDDFVNLDFPTPESGSMSPRRAFEMRREGDVDGGTLFDYSQEPDPYNFEQEVLGHAPSWRREWPSMRHLADRIKRNEPLTIYRAAERGEGPILPGAYTSINRAYVEKHAQAQYDSPTKSEIHELTVRPSELFSYGDPHEFIYMPEDEGEAYERYRGQLGEEVHESDHWRGQPRDPGGRDGGRWIRAFVSATSYRSGDKNAFWETETGRSFLRDLDNEPAAFNLSLTRREGVDGLWLGELEPSQQAEVKGELPAVRRWAATLGKRYDQDAVGLFSEGEGDGWRYELQGVDRTTALPATVEHDLPGGTLRGDTLEILDLDGSDADKVRALSEALDVDVVATPGHVEFVDRDEYEAILSRDGEAPTLHREGTPEGASDGGDVPAQDRGPPEPPRSLDAVTARHADLEWAVREGGDYLALDLIRVPPQSRGQGKGAAAMRDLLAYADSVRKPIILTPEDPAGEGSKARLKRWYKALGFTPNKGKRLDYGLPRGELRRDPA